MALQHYVICPACGRSERVERMLERKNDAIAGGAFWNLEIRGLGRPTNEEIAAAQREGRKVRRGGFENIVERDVVPDRKIIAELRRRCQAFLSATEP